MIQIQNIPLPIGGGEEQLRKRAARLLGLNPGQLRSLTLARQSIDARKNPTCTMSAPSMWRWTTRPGSWPAAGTKM